MPPYLEPLRFATPRPPLNSCCQQMLDALPGLCCLIDRDGLIGAVAHDWDEQVVRLGHGDWLCSQVQGQPFASLLPSEDLNAAFRVALSTLAAGAPEAALRLTDPAAPKPLLLQFTFRVLRTDDRISGFLAQGLDVTQEHLTRAALLERERKLRELKALNETQAVEITALQTAAAELAERPPAPATPPPPNTLRALAADLAEEYGNLLTGVLGHVSLAVSELDDRPSALDDVRAIERAARRAARLTRRLAAVTYSPRRCQPVDLAPLLESAALRLQASEPVLTAEPCSVMAESSVLEMIIEGMSEHAREAGAQDGGWILAREDEQAVVALIYAGAAAIPAGWQDEPPSHGRLSGLLYAREAARALGGDLELARMADGSRLVLRLPCVSTPIPELVAL